jgi:hypothetical protein
MVGLKDDESLAYVEAMMREWNESVWIDMNLELDTPTDFLYALCCPQQSHECHIHHHCGHDEDGGRALRMCRCVARRTFRGLPSWPAHPLHLRHIFLGFSGGDLQNDTPHGQPCMRRQWLLLNVREATSSRNGCLHGSRPWKRRNGKARARRCRYQPFPCAVWKCLGPERRSWEV